MIHQFKLDGFCVVLDIYSGAIHVVDPVAYDIIALYQNHSAEQIISIILERYAKDEDVTQEDIRLCLSDIESLIKANKLFSKDPFSALESHEFKKTNTTLKAMCIHIAHTCNLTCDYCFAKQGNYQGADAVMSYEVGKQALDYLIRESEGRRNLEVDFFGGEPLMNWQVIKDLVAYAREQESIHDKNFRFTLTTNGVLIDDDVIEFANKEMHNVVLSLDGRKEVHDRLRKTANGRGSYDVIVPKFQEFVEKRGGKDYYLRGTYTNQNIDFTNDILHMLDLGFRELSMEPVVCSPDDEVALTEKDLPALFEQYELLGHEMLKRYKQNDEFTFYHYIMDLNAGPCLHKRIAGCGSGTEYLAVTPWGDLYPCHQFVTHPEFKMGNVWDGITKPEKIDDFAKCNIYANPTCRDCWAKMFCAGGCTANAYHTTGSIFGVYEFGCELFKKRVECAIVLQIAKGLHVNA